jgi:hypothetical protein
MTPPSAAVKGAKDAKPSAKAGRRQPLDANFLSGLSATGPARHQTPPGHAAGPMWYARIRDQPPVEAPLARVPQGVDTDQLVTILAFDLTRMAFGRAGAGVAPGVTDPNAPAGPDAPRKRHPCRETGGALSLPPEYYDSWKHVEWRFDRNCRNDAWDLAVNSPCWCARG